MWIILWSKNASEINIVEHKNITKNIIESFKYNFWRFSKAVRHFVILEFVLLWLLINIAQIFTLD